MMNLLGFGATALPGWLALKIEPRLIIKLTASLKKNILVTGTNGKTTTTRLIASIFKEAGQPFIHNRSGSNLLRGLASVLIKEANLKGKILARTWGLWEVDEAVFPLACEQIKPQVVLIANLFRDQLDRYGEIDKVAQSWHQALLKLPATSAVVLNADDATVASLGKNLKSKVFYYGLAEENWGRAEPDHASDATLCPYCLQKLTYSLCFGGHMGNYSCPRCGQIQPKKHFILKKTALKEVSEKLPGVYNLYNLAAANALTTALNFSEKQIIAGLKNFKPAFGRMEKVSLDHKTLHLFLVKNPTGFNEVIKTLTSHSLPKGVRRHLTCLIAINDLIADGTDVSWLWDVNFESLIPYLKTVIVSGRRAYDMALRLKYAQHPFGFKFYLQPQIKKALNQFLLYNEADLYVLPTYTAMLHIRKILNQQGFVHSSWQD